MIRYLIRKAKKMRGLSKYVDSEVEVYFNLIKKVWSVRDPKTKKIIGHCKFLSISPTEFNVGDGGRDRVLDERRKNVHAFVKGYLIDYNCPWDRRGDEISYEPYFANYFFTTKDKKPVCHYYEFLFFDGDTRKIYGTGKRRIGSVTTRP